MYYAIAAGVITIAGAIPTCNSIKSTYFTTSHEKFIDENYIIGVMAPFYVGQTLMVNAGGMRFNAEIPASGVIDDIYPMVGCSTPSDKTMNEFNYGLKINGHRFLLSILIKDFKTGEIIGELDDNKWSIKKSSIYDYNDNNLIEIIDKYGYVAFSMWLDDNMVLQIRGYFVGALCTYFMNGTVLNMVSRDDPKYEEKCISYAAKLLPRHSKQSI